MVDPMRLKVLKALCDKLAEISAPEFNFTLSGNVFRGRATFGADDPLPLVSVLEDPQTTAPQAPPKFTSEPVRMATMNLLVQGWAERPIQAQDNGTDAAYYLLSDVQRKLAEIVSERGPKGGFLSDTAETLLIGEPVVRPPDETSDAAWFWLRVTVSYFENLADPAWMPYSGD